MLNLQKKVQEVYVADVVLDYIAKLAEATRDHELITLGSEPTWNSCTVQDDKGGCLYERTGLCCSTGCKGCV